MREGVCFLINKENIVYLCKLTSELSTCDKKDFIEIFNTVFDMNYNMEWFNWKYMDNIYGDSYIVLVYYDNKPIAAKAFWRNDIQGYKSYQPCDTGVLKEYRKMGIFTDMTI